MKLYFTKCSVQVSYVLQLLSVLLFSFSSSFGTIGITVNGQANGATFEQGSVFVFSITGLANGATVTNQLWIDKNNNGVIDPLSDLLFVEFPETDGVGGGNQGPGDDDGTANGTITTTIGGVSFPATNYIIKSTSGANSGTSTYTLTALTNVTYHVSGRVTKAGLGVPDVIVRLRLETSQIEFYVLSDASGNYSIATNATAGNTVRVSIPTDGFNPSFSGNIFTPDQYNFVLNTDATGLNFVMMSGKIVTGKVTDTSGNPIQDMNVDISPYNGGNGHSGRTDVNGRYFISVDTGYYRVQFGNDNEPKGYIKTYYNQKYVNWMSDVIHVTLATDTLKNIDAVLRKGGLIMGTFMNGGVSVRGNITAFAYNAPGSGLYEAWHDSDMEHYYLFVPPGIYTIQFNLENNGGMGTQVLYNQTQQWPGTPVTVLSLSDTAKNINVDFSSVPKTYVFIGWGNWGDPSNWNNMQMPPASLPPGDMIIINGQCILNSEQHILQGATLIISSGGNLTVPGSLTVH